MNPHVVKLKCAILEQAGHEVTPATSAHQAIEMIKSQDYDAVVTDWRLGDDQRPQGCAGSQEALNYASGGGLRLRCRGLPTAEPLADLVS